MKQTLLIFSLLLTMVASCQVKKDSVKVNPKTITDFTVDLTSVNPDEYYLSNYLTNYDQFGNPIYTLLDTTYFTQRNTTLYDYVNGMWQPYDFVFYIDTTTNIYDTIKVMMLICDTSFIDGYSYTQAEYDSSNNPKHYLYIENRFPSVLWVFGYEVRKVEKRNNVDGRIDPYAEFGFKYQEWNVYYHNEYLDIDKKQLPQYFIVWQTKQ